MNSCTHCAEVIWHRRGLSENNRAGCQNSGLLENVILGAFLFSVLQRITMLSFNNNTPFWFLWQKFKY